MNHRLIWVVLVVVGMALGLLLGGQEQTTAQAPTSKAAKELDGEVLEQLKQVNAQLKELNAMFRTGNARVVVVINPESP